MDVPSVRWLSDVWVWSAPGRRMHAGKKDKPTVALVMKSLANEFFKTMEEGAKAHHEQHKDEYDLKVVGIKNETDVAEQIRSTSSR